MDTMLTYNTNSKTGPVCGGRAVETMKINRPQFGKILQRDVKTKSYETNISGKPDLEHVVIQFQTKFEHKAKGIETITPVKDSDGVWRVWGYYIK